MTTSRRDIECSRELTIQHDTSFTEPTFKSYGLYANKATMSIHNVGEFVVFLLFDYKNFDFIENRNALSSVKIGDIVSVSVDYGKDLPENMNMSISTCTITSPIKSLEFISNGTVMPFLDDMVQLIPSISNRQASFTWKVFQPGNGSRSMISWFL